MSVIQKCQLCYDLFGLLRKSSFQYCKYFIIYLSPCFFSLQVVDFLLVMNEQHGEIGLQSQLSRSCGWRLPQQPGTPGTGLPEGGASARPHTADVPPGGLLSVLCGCPRTSSQHSRGHLYFHQADNEETDQCFPRSCLLSGQSKGCLLHSNRKQLDHTNQTFGL